MDIEHRIIEEINVFVIAAKKNGKGPLSMAEESQSGFPWTRFAVDQKLADAFVYLKRGVYLDSTLDLDCLMWFLKGGAIVVVEGADVLGEEALRNLTDDRKYQRSCPGRCRLGSHELQGYSGLAIIDKFNQWANRRRLTDDDKRKWALIGPRLLQ